MADACLTIDDETNERASGRELATRIERAAARNIDLDAMCCSSLDDSSERPFRANIETPPSATNFT